jgi:hypothetical protein
MATQPAPKPVNLTQTASFLRNFIKFSAVLLVVLMVGRVFFTSLIAYLKSITPPKQTPPTVGFKVLPKIPFPVQPNAPSSYRLETVGGQLPAFGDRAKVFFMPAAQPSLTAVDRAKRKASSLGYMFDFESLDSRTYRWTNTNPLLSTLEIDILTETFNITTNWPSHPELLTNKQIINSTSLINNLKSLLSQANGLPEDLKNGIARTRLVKAIGGELVEAVSLSEADFLQIDLYRKQIDDKYGSVTSKGKEGPIHAVLASNGTVLVLNMNYYPVEYDIVETYPLLPTDQAWQILSSGAGYVAEKGTADVAVVRNVSLAYYEPDEETPYYRPVYLFEGDGGFIGMVDALDPVWIAK